MSIVLTCVFIVVAFFIGHLLGWIGGSQRTKEQREDGVFYLRDGETATLNVNVRFGEIKEYYDMPIPVCDDKETKENK